ncbi:histidine kinase [uncultured Massilia sp.]|uniref:sensor histidine kinase n=1 Tax=uncultured Massilia sp. TaxID=169973 RepID=UPI0025DCC6C0|nr:histidine kinase [uncultured Massilia sp.]
MSLSVPVTGTAQEPVLAPELQDAAADIYLFDAATLRLVDANAGARLGGIDPARLAEMTLFELAPELEQATLDALLAQLGHAPGAQATLRTRYLRAGGTYPVKLVFLRIVRDGRALLLAVADDLALALEISVALEQYQAGFDAVVDHTPGLVYQFLRQADGTVAFPYLSEGCAALLGLAGAELQAAPQRFLELVLPEDRGDYLDAMDASQAGLSAWNWEGRIWIDAWKDVKWINLRATPFPLEDGGVRWDGIMTNITASKLEQEEIRDSRARLAELTDHIEQVKEQERARIAREIHDDLGGNLTAIKMALAMLAARLPADPVLAEKAQYVDDLVDRTIDAVHRISLDLRPPMLDLGIVAALDWQAREFEKRMGIACVFTSSDREVALAPSEATALFRIFQEALTNIAKHAHATRVTVDLRREGRHLVLAICDNGRGIAASDRAKPQSFGLRGMSERARALGGTLDLAPAPGGGTMVTVRIRPSAPAAAGQPSTTEA